MILSTIVIAVILIYFILIGSLTYGFDKVESFKLQDLKPFTKFSIIIPFRNEADNLPELLKSISNLNYPKSHFEIILVNDASEDQSVAVIEKIMATKSFKKDFSRSDNIQITHNNRITNSPKKDAITSAVSLSKFNWIVTTDADCKLPKYWLDAIDECIQVKQPNCIVAPVKYKGENSFFNRFQILDFLSLQGATIGGFGIKKPFMCNGANLAYKKSAFIALNGFDGNTDIASGDDLFLLEKLIKQDAKSIQYLKSNKAIVNTKPAENLKALIEQRLRWASKTSSYNNRFAKLVGITVLLANFVCLAFIPFAIFGLVSFKTIISLLVIKLGIDFLLLFKASRFFKQETLLLSYLFSSFIYPIFSIYIAVLSFYKPFNWKGRTFKK
ncbi:glycosyltransferase family 2 protein [Winogradskyella sp. UBA3174]|uniref:glycosyltransferase family 2 protein n=1 Tax=Winogradskyella sp. UBA3174 TaxID=1947785 RepID=UPI0025FCF02D|nr:glycosyltransferase [Winogradskyella sp. UBA3174]|tara:strand:+ start:13104 stop:14258 length:1155 start_codon:yes stop_codon:yes gene_type:complete